MFGMERDGGRKEKSRGETGQNILKFSCHSGHLALSSHLPHISLYTNIGLANPLAAYFTVITKVTQPPSLPSHNFSVVPPLKLVTTNFRCAQLLANVIQINPNSLHTQSLRVTHQKLLFSQDSQIPSHIPSLFNLIRKSDQIRIDHVILSAWDIWCRQEWKPSWQQCQI